MRAPGNQCPAVPSPRAPARVTAPEYDPEIYAGALAAYDSDWIDALLFGTKVCAPLRRFCGPAGDPATPSGRLAAPGRLPTP